MSKKVVKKKKSKLIKTRLFTVLFAVMFIVSLFTGIKAFAETGPFKLNSATISDKASGVTGSISSFNDSEVINDITFHKLDDYATFNFELKSNLNREITILEITDDNSNSYIAYEYDKHENEKLASNGTLNFIVKAVYKNELTDTSKRNQTNNVKFTIKYLDNGEEKSDEIIVNPKTGDGISKSIVMLIISSVGLVTCITLDKKRKSKKLSKLSVLILTGLVLSPIVVKAATFAYELTLKSTIGLYDKVIVTIDDKVNPVTTQTIEYNTKLDSLPSPTKTGYTLTNWTVNNEEFDITKEIKEDITIEANYRKNSYTISFNANVPVGGTLDPATSMADMDMKYDEEKNLLPNGYLVTGYLFDSWNTMPDGSGTKYEDMDSVKNLTSTDGETVTLYARWGATPYTIIFDKNSNEATGTMENISKAYNETFNLPENTYERTGYSFAGWNTSPMGDGTHYDNKQSVKNLDIDGEVTLYAEWSPALVTISFDINTDDPEATGTMAGQIVVYDVQNRLNENKYTRTGYAFDSWNTEPDGSGTKYDDKADITNVFLDNTTLYAQWAATPYTIIFDKNNSSATGNMENMSVQYGVEVNLSENTFVVDEYDTYKFVGWNTMPDGSGTHYDDKQLVKNLDIDGEITLYAEWKLINAFFGSVKPAMNSITSEHPEITTFKKYTLGKPSDSLLENAVDVGESSGEPIYLFNNGEYLYWWSEVKHPKLDKNNGEGKFAYVSKIEYLDCREIDTRGVTNLRAYFGNSNFETIDISDWDFSSVTNFSYSFTNSKIKTIIWPESTDLKKVQDFTRMFASTSLLESLDLSSWTLRDAKDMSNMFDGSNINSITFGNGFNTSNVQNMTGMFNSTKISSIDVSRFNTSNVQNMSSMFANMTSLTEIDLSNFNSENLSNMQSMFSGDKNLTTITFGNNFTAEKVQNMASTFINCSKLETLDLSRFHAIALSTMRYTFGGCKALTNINFGNNFDGRNITTMDYAFLNDSSLTKLDFSSFNTQSLSSIDYMAADASNLEILIFGSNFKTSGITDEWLESPFRGVNKLKKIYSGIDFDLSNETSGIELFPSNPDLVGGQGTTYDSSYGREYYRIDDPDNGKPGYFTDISEMPQP